MAKERKIDLNANMAPANETVDKQPADSSQPSLATCSSEELATWLHQNRFKDEMDVTTFLLSAVSALPNAQAIADQLCQEEETPQNETSGMGARLSNDSSTLSLISPRGKFVADWYESGLQLVDSKKNILIIKPRTLQYIVIFPKPEDMRATKKASTQTEYALLVFQNDAECQYKNKPLKQLCLQLPSNADDSSTLVDALCEDLEVDHKDIVRVSDSSFQSHQESDTSTTTGGMPFIQCYHGVNDGVLFPLEAGLLFFKPPLFLPLSDVVSMACGRHGSDVGGRYIDIAVLKTDNTEVQFSNIHKAEATGLNLYIKGLISDGEAETDVQSEASVEEDNLPWRGGRPSRKASRAARAACRYENQKNDGDEDGDEDDESDEDFDVAKVTHEDGESESDDDDEEGEEGDCTEDSKEEEEGAQAQDEDTESEDENEQPTRKKGRRS